MEIKEYVKKVDWTPVDYDWLYGFQCVDLVKDFSEKVLWIKLGAFGWSAKTGWLNKAETFDLKIFDKFLNDWKNEFQPGDLLFHTRWKYWHTAIFLENLTNWKIKILEQNAGDWSGYWKINYVKISEVDKNFFEWFYRKKGFLENKNNIFEEKIKRAIELWIFNWKNWKIWATREEVALMCLKIYDLIKK